MDKMRDNRWKWFKERRDKVSKLSKGNIPMQKERGEDKGRKIGGLVNLMVGCDGEWYKEDWYM